MTFIWTVLAALIAALIGLVVNFSVDAKWVAPFVMFATMVALAFYGRIRRRDREKVNGH